MGQAARLPVVQASRLHYDRKTLFMERPFTQIEVELHGDAFCVCLRHPRLDEKGLEELGAEISRLIDEQGCRKMVINLGPEDPLCLYSVFLAKLVNLQRRLQVNGGVMALAQVSPDTLKIFQVTGLEKFFTFFPTQEAALAGLTRM